MGNECSKARARPRSASDPLLEDPQLDPTGDQRGRAMSADGGAPGPDHTSGYTGAATATDTAQQQGAQAWHGAGGGSHRSLEAFRETEDSATNDTEQDFLDDLDDKLAGGALPRDVSQDSHSASGFAGGGGGQAAARSRSVDHRMGGVPRRRSSLGDVDSVHSRRHLQHTDYDDPDHGTMAATEPVAVAQEVVVVKKSLPRFMQPTRAFSAKTERKRPKSSKLERSWGKASVSSQALRRRRTMNRLSDPATRQRTRARRAKSLPAREVSRRARSSML